MAEPLTRKTLFSDMNFSGSLEKSGSDSHFPGNLSYASGLFSCTIRRTLVKEQPISELGPQMSTEVVSDMFFGQKCLYPKRKSVGGRHSALYGRRGPSGEKISHKNVISERRPTQKYQTPQNKNKNRVGKH